MFLPLTGPLGLYRKAPNLASQGCFLRFTALCASALSPLPLWQALFSFLFSTVPSLPPASLVLSSSPFSSKETWVEEGLQLGDGVGYMIFFFKVGEQ